MDTHVVTPKNRSAGDIIGIDMHSLKSSYKAIERSASLLSQTALASSCTKEKHLLNRIAAERIAERKELLKVLNQHSDEFERYSEEDAQLSNRKHPTQANNDKYDLIDALLQDESKNAEAVKQAVLRAKSTHIKNVLLNHYANLTATIAVIALKLKTTHTNDGISKLSA